MRRFSNSEFINLWERGLQLHPLDQGLLALAMALPENTYENLADWPLGQRNRTLAELRCACFGPRLQAWTTCPQCGGKLEFEMDCRALAEAGPDLNHSVEVNGCTYRLPTSRDLARVVNESDAGLAALRLAEGCRIGTCGSPRGNPVQLEELEQKLAAADPMAEIRLTLECPECGNSWEDSLDIAGFFWMEIEARSRRLLMETHTLASAYGWTEREILSLGEARRAFYLEMVQR
jgi:hypothetical protein